MSEPVKSATTADPERTLQIASGYSDGGHEVDTLPATRLIGLLGGMAMLILLTGVALYQYYNLNASADSTRAAQEASARISVVNAARAAVAETWAETDAKNGVWRMPASEGAKRVIANPALLRAAARPAGFVDPDDVKKEGAAATPEPAVVPAAAPPQAVPPQAVPTEVAPENPVVPTPAEDTAPAPAEGATP